MNQNGLEIQLQKIEFILLQSQSHEPISLSLEAFQAAMNIFAHAMVDKMYDMFEDLDYSDEEMEQSGAAFNSDFAFMIKQYTNITALL